MLCLILWKWYNKNVLINKGFYVDDILFYFCFWKDNFVFVLFFVNVCENLKSNCFGKFLMVLKYILFWYFLNINVFYNV